ncbi:MAG: VWA domain-containing protein [Alphaproteobacteria bacterium]|nr:VWA domain-containing protein [Alphaproteobacteria bacterium]
MPSFLAAEFLWVLLILPLAVALYIHLIRRRKPSALRYPNLGLIKEAVGPRGSVRRHVPPVLALLAIAVMIVGIARPTTVLTLPSERSTVVLAMDVSGSMRAADVEPDRMSAAKSAARGFVSDQARSTRIGLVAFSTSAMIMQDPTISRTEVTEAIDALRPQRFTAVGSGIVAALQAIDPEDPITMSLNTRNRSPYAEPLGELKPDQPALDLKPLPPGSNTSAVIVLLSDGRTNAGVEPLDAARLAADRGIRVFTVGFGTPTGGIIDFGGGMMRTQLDEETLQAIADMTGAKYFHAATEADLKEAYSSLTAQFVSETKRTEVSAGAAGIALVLLIIAGALSLMWSSRLA